MANILPHIEDSSWTTYIPPKGDYETFADESDYAEKVKEWGLSTTREIKKQFWYKEATYQRLVTIKGYEVYGKNQAFNTIVIEFQDGNFTCIHPAYLKEMQSPSFGKSVISSPVEVNVPHVSLETKKPLSTESTAGGPVPIEKPAQKTKKEKTAKLVLPEEKVHFTATVKQFALTWNNFTEKNDEVVILESVILSKEEPIEIGYAWCSHSKTLGKLELTPGVSLEFDGKIVKKKLPKGKDTEEEFNVNVPVPYKINNPSKIKKS